MAETKERVTVWVCDGCGDEFIQRAGGEPPLGVYGDAMWHHEGGGSGGKFFACCLAHVADAIERVVHSDA